MKPQRFATVAAASCGTVVLAGWIVASLAGFGSAGIEITAAVPIEDRPATSLAADAALAVAPQATVMGNAVVASAEVATAAGSVTGTATDTMAASDKPESIVVAALPDPSQMLPPETPPVTTASTPDPVPNDAKETVDSVEILDECLVAEICIDRYLWALYQRTPKMDTIKVYERRKVTVRKKGKTKTVTKRFTRLVDNDFTWKDPKAAEKVGMTMMDYVIGGMDRSFKLKLFHTRQGPVLPTSKAPGRFPGLFVERSIPWPSERHIRNDGATLGDSLPGAAHAMMRGNRESGSPCAFSAFQYLRRSCAPSLPRWPMAG